MQYQSITCLNDRALGSTNIAFYQNIITKAVNVYIVYSDALAHQLRPRAAAYGDTIIAAQNFRCVKKEDLVHNAGPKRRIQHPAAALN